MKHAYRNVLVASASALFLVAAVGCSSDSDTDPAPAPVPVPTPETPDVTPETPGETPEMPAAAVLDGSWLRACSANEIEGEETTYDTVTLTIAGASATSRRQDYTDAACLTPATPAETVITVDLAFPEGMTDTPRGMAMHVDDTPVSISRDGVEPTAEQREAIAAQGGFDTRHDIAIVVDDALYFGDLSSDPERDGASPERRPETLESTPYVRQ